MKTSLWIGALLIALGSASPANAQKYIPFLYVGKNAWPGLDWKYQRGCVVQLVENTPEKAKDTGRVVFIYQETLNGYYDSLKPDSIYSFKASGYMFYYRHAGNWSNALLSFEHTGIPYCLPSIWPDLMNCFPEQEEP